MTLDARVELTIGSLTLDVDLRVAAGETVILAGPNGAGKTTLLRAIAGLRAIDRGAIRLGERVLDDPVAGVFVPPHQRSIGMVFQDYALFGHLDATENVGFGLRARGTSRRAARAVAQEWLDRVGMSTHARALPHQLSGGQQQRVALARALCGEPEVLLLDEPLAALDATARPELRALVAVHLAAFDGIAIVVSHDAADASEFAARRIELDQGRVVA